MLTLVSRTLVQYFFHYQSTENDESASLVVQIVASVVTDACFFLLEAMQTILCCFNHCLLSYFFQIIEIPKRTGSSVT